MVPFLSSLQFLLKTQLITIWGFLYMFFTYVLFVAFPLLLLIIFFAFNFCYLINMFLSIFFLGFIFVLPGPG